jgi:hypothetical protein
MDGGDGRALQKRDKRLAFLRRTYKNHNYRKYMKFKISKSGRVKPNLMKVLSILSCCGFCVSTHAYTVSGNVYSTNGSQSDTQAAINAAKHGAVIQLPAGSFTWSSGVIVKAGMAIRGQGISSTTLTNPGTSYSLFDVTCDQAWTRISKIAFKGQFSLNIHGSYTTATFRIHDCTFSSGTTLGILLQVDGNGPGLVDHCTFTGGGASEMIHNMGLGADNGDAAWLDNVSPGSPSTLYIENCTFSKDPLQDAYFYGTSAIQSYYGARTVVRHSVFNACQIDQHGNVGVPGARWFEIYDNTFYTPAGMNQSNCMALRGGSGVVFNNVKTGSNLGTGAIELYDENGGPSPLYLGRGIDQDYSPVYLWNNSARMPVTSGSSNVILGRDFFVSTSQPTSMISRESLNHAPVSGYTPDAYPHEFDNEPTSAFGPPH